MCVCLHGSQTHLQIEQNSSYPHGLADFQAVGEEREAWGALVVGRQNLNVHCSDGAPGRMKSTHQPTDSIGFSLTTCWAGLKYPAHSVVKNVHNTKSHIKEKKSQQVLVTYLLSWTFIWLGMVLHSVSNAVRAFHSWFDHKPKFSLLKISLLVLSCSQQHTWKWNWAADYLFIHCVRALLWNRCEGSCTNVFEDDLTCAVQ